MNSKEQVQLSHTTLDELVDVIFDDLQDGKIINLEQLVEQHPDLEDRIRGVYPTLLAMADWDSSDESVDLFSSELEPDQNKSLGDFQILNEIGRGGMGVVYEAQQLSINRRVALKVLPLASLIDERALKRFRNEVSAIATLQHPNIVSVYSVGEERGIHFYAMELVRGQSLAAIIRELRTRSENSTPLTGDSFGQVVSDMENNDNRRASERDQIVSPTVSKQPAEEAKSPQAETRARAHSNTASSRVNQIYLRTAVRIIVQAANALQHSHECGVTHRDIKPGNLLIDKSGTVFVSDFGLARFEASPGLTMTGEMLGTLRYMSPEQVLANRVVVDHRTDVYSLGATLYELLILHPMWPTKERAELIRQISFEEPVRPGKINHSIPMDLETIVLKAIRKNPAERYQHAQEMADDLQRFLDDKPIVARRPTVTQRLTKWSQRNPTVMWTTVVFLLVFAVGSTASTALVLQANHRTQQAMNSVEQRANENEAVLDFFVRDLLGAASPSIGNGKDATVLQVLQHAEGQIDGRFDEYPLVEASVRHAIGETYLSLTDYVTAEEQLHRANEIRRAILGFENRQTLNSSRVEAQAINQQGRPDDALPLITETFACQLFLFGKNDEDTLLSKAVLAVVLARSGKRDEACQILTLVLKEQQRQLNGLENIETLKTKSWLAQVLKNSGRDGEALVLHKELAKSCKELLGPYHPRTLNAEFYVGLIGNASKDYFASLTQRCLDNLGESHLITNNARFQLSQKEPNLKRQRDLLQQVLEIRQQNFGALHPTIPVTLSHLATNLKQQGKSAEAKDGFRDILDVHLARANSPNSTANDINSAAWFILNDLREYDSLFRPRVALKLAQRACEIAEDDHNPNLWSYLDTRALAEHLTGSTDEAVDTQQMAIDMLLLSTPQSNVEEFKQRLADYKFALDQLSNED